jgi:hypothetical protein
VYRQRSAPEQRPDAARAPVCADTSIVGLHRRAGNRAVARLLLAREVGWKGPDVVTAGKGWNTGEKRVGKIRRIPLQDLPVGLQKETATHWVWDDKEHTKGHTATESTTLRALSPETAKGRAIVLAPAALDPAKDVEVVVFLHGYTEGTHRPFAGWRALQMPKAEGSQHVKDLRRGIEKDDTAPVRDVALDQAEAQLEESGQTQTVIVLPQGGLHSQFGNVGPDYAPAIVSRLVKEGIWAKAPNVARVTMAGHSGAGATLGGMAGRAELTGDLVILDAINGAGEREGFWNWAKARLEADLRVLQDAGRTDERKLEHLRTAPKLRGFYSDDGYKPQYDALEGAIDDWFRAHCSELGPFAGCLRANFTFTHVAVGHEELMRGAKIETARAAGTGTILEALRSLHRPAYKSTGECPPLPASAVPRTRPAKRQPALR